MSRKQRKPIWLIPYGFVILMIVALVLEGKDNLPGWANELLGIGIVFFVFSLIALWVHLNTAALMDEEIERAKNEKLIITEYPPTQPQKSARKEFGDPTSDDHKDKFNEFRDPYQIKSVIHSRN
jgi:hypothetical protein